MTLQPKWITVQDTDERLRILKAFNQDPFTRNLSTVTKDILINRGVQTVEEVKQILDDDIMNQYNPMELKDMNKLVQYLKKFIEEKKHIVVYGDYDADGACATAIAVLCLRELGAHVDYFINNRFKHGYGMTPDGVKDLKERYPTVDVIVTVDNGIVAYKGIEEAKKEGIEVLITDHHEPSPDGTLPDVLAVVNPKRLDETYPFREICGATVIYKAMMCLYVEMDQPLDYVYSMVDIVGVATIGDVMPLKEENRLFVKESINLINKRPRYAFQRLKEAIGKTEIDEGTFGFQFVPMINAIGRLKGTIDEAVEMFLATDKEKVDQLVDYLVKVNEKRKEITKKQEEIAIEMVEKQGVDPVIVLANESFEEGIVGLIAGRIKERYHRPTIALTKTKEGLWKGSGRSIEAFSLIDNLHTVKETLYGYGGHDMACGVSVEETNIESFRQAMIKRANVTLNEEDFIPKVLVDVYVRPEELDENLINELEQLKPFGTQFEMPNIAITDFSIERVFSMGKTKEHLKLINPHTSIIMWSGVNHYKKIGEPQRVQAIGVPTLNYWNGKTSVQFVVKDELMKTCV